MTALTLLRNVFDDDHDAFRRTTRDFCERDVAPHLTRWAQQKSVDRDLYRRAADIGLLGIDVPERFSGGGVKDFRFNAIVIEELCRVGALSVTMNLSGFNDLVAPYFIALGTDEQNDRWLAPMCRGEKIGALAMTEPGTGSDLAAISTTALPDGDDLVLRGSKTFISNGMLADIVVVIAKTDPSAGRRGFSIIVVEDGTAGFTKTGPLDKLGLIAQDTAELHFDNVRVPKSAVLGEIGRGFDYLRTNLPQERLNIAVASMASMVRTFEQAVQYGADRHAFGQRLADLQANRFYLAELATEIEVAQVFIDRCILEAARDALPDVTAAKAKWWVTELHRKVVDRALQLHGGYGYMREYPVAQDYVDCRAATIYGGSTEIMKEIIGRQLIARRSVRREMR